jgi:hypothetical protein
MRRSNDAHVFAPCSGCSVIYRAVFLLGSVGLLFLVHSASAQRSPGTVNLGVQVGQPSGITGKLYRSPPTAYAGLFTTDADESAALYLYRLRERPLPDSLMHLYVGPGLLLGAHALDTPTPNPDLGLTLQAGLNFYADRFEVFLHVTPILRFLPKIRPALGGSVGLRYTFGSP